MNNDQKLLVQKTFEMVIPIAEVAAGLFYGRLFEVDPSLKPLFRGDIKDQGKKLMATLKIAVTSLDRLDGLVPVVQALGRRHLAYGVRDEHYDTVGGALLWTLEKGLGEAFTPRSQRSVDHRVHDLGQGHERCSERSCSAVVAHAHVASSIDARTRCNVPAKLPSARRASRRSSRITNAELDAFVDVQRKRCPFFKGRCDLRAASHQSRHQLNDTRRSLRSAQRVRSKLVGAPTFSFR
jgi:hemoglobin-like flavoprotein